MYVYRDKLDLPGDAYSLQSVPPCPAPLCFVLGTLSGLLRFFSDLEPSESSLLEVISQHTGLVCAVMSVLYRLCICWQPAQQIPVLVCGGVSSSTPTHDPTWTISVGAGSWTGGGREVGGAHLVQHIIGDHTFWPRRCLWWQAACLFRTAFGASRE